MAKEGHFEKDCVTGWLDYLFTNENFPNNIQNLAKWVQNFAQHSINPQKWPKTFEIA